MEYKSRNETSERMDPELEYSQNPLHVYSVLGNQSALQFTDGDPQGIIQREVSPELRKPVKIILNRLIPNIENLTYVPTLCKAKGVYGYVIEFLCILDVNNVKLDGDPKEIEEIFQLHIHVTFSPKIFENPWLGFQTNISQHNSSHFKYDDVQSDAIIYYGTVHELLKHFFYNTMLQYYKTRFPGLKYDAPPPKPPTSWGNVKF